MLSFGPCFYIFYFLRTVRRYDFRICFSSVTFSILVDCFNPFDD